MANENYSEKVSVNINTSTLSNIDIPVDKGYYSNRSDFINQALRGDCKNTRASLTGSLINTWIQRTKTPTLGLWVSTPWKVMSWKLLRSEDKS